METPMLCRLIAFLITPEVISIMIDLNVHIWRM